MALTLWHYAANHSSHEWRVFLKEGRPHAQLASETPEKRADQPGFTPVAGDLRGARSFARVKDGWLVGFNKGEFGGALYWFSQDGKSSYKISDHQVVDFFSLSNGVYAIEGLEHLGTSQGSVIRISRPNDQQHWQATLFATLPFAPCAVALRTNGTMIITLSDWLVSVSRDQRVNTLLSDAPWGGLYPNSSVLTTNEQKLYIGMRQYVGEFDLLTRKLRFLIPSNEFLNKLDKETEEQVRKQHGG